MKLLLMLVAAVVLFAAPAFAQAPDSTSVPWYSLANLTISTGANYAWWRADTGPVNLNVQKEWNVGLYNALALTKHWDAIGTVERGLDTKIWQFKVGFRFVLKGAD